METQNKRTRAKGPEVVKLTVSLPRSVAAFLRWKAEMEGIRRDDLLRNILMRYAKKVKQKDVDTPAVWDDPNIAAARDESDE